MKRARATQKNAPEAEAALLTKSQLARLLGVSTKTIERHGSDFPPAIMLGTARRWSRVVVEKWLENAKQN